MWNLFPRSQGKSCVFLISASHIATLQDLGCDIPTPLPGCEISESLFSELCSLGYYLNRQLKDDRVWYREVKHLTWFIFTVNLHNLKN